MKKTIAIIVATIFLFSMAAISAAAEKVEMEKPAEKMPAEVPKSVSPEMEKLGKPGGLKEEEKQEGFKELTPDEQKELEEFEEQEKRQFRNLPPEEIKWGEQEKPAK